MRSPVQLLLAATVAVLALAAPVGAEAQTATANMTVSASVAKSCVVSGPASAVNFSAYDPVSSTQLSAVGTISVRCVRGTGYSVALSSTSGFAMTGAGGAIPYTILQPNGSTLWNTTPLVVNAADITTSVAKNYDATVRPAVGADVPAGSYSDTVLITVTY